VKTSFDRQIIRKSGSLNLMADFTILMGSPEIAVGAHAQYRIHQNSPERLPRRHAAFKLQYIRNWHLLQ